MFKNKYGVGKNRSSLVLFFAILFHSGITQDTAPPTNVAYTMESAQALPKKENCAQPLCHRPTRPIMDSFEVVLCFISILLASLQFFHLFIVLALQEEPEDGDGAGTERVEARLKQNYAFQPGFVSNVIYTI